MEEPKGTKQKRAEVARIIKEINLIDEEVERKTQKMKDIRKSLKERKNDKELLKLELMDVMEGKGQVESNGIIYKISTLRTLEILEK